MPPPTMTTRAEAGRSGMSVGPGGARRRPCIPDAAEVADRGAAGFAQHDEVVGTDDHAVAAIKQLAGRPAGVGDRAHRLAAGEDDLLGALDQGADVGMVELVQATNGAREVVRADEGDVDAVGAADLGRALDRPADSICSTSRRLALALW